MNITTPKFRIEDVRQSSLTTQLGYATQAYEHSWYTILGASDVIEFAAGYVDLMEQAGIGAPSKFVAIHGGTVNQFAQGRAGAVLASTDLFPSDLTVILFPLDSLDVGKLAMFKLRMEDRWFDDVVQNMVRRARS